MTLKVNLPTQPFLPWLRANRIWSGTSLLYHQELELLISPCATWRSNSRRTTLQLEDRCTPHHCEEWRSGLDRTRLLETCTSRWDLAWNLINMDQLQERLTKPLFPCSRRLCTKLLEEM